jgi:hypothetical protein
MTNRANSSNTFYPPGISLELELLETLLTPEDETYPWNPTELESEAYFLEAESHFVLQDVMEEELDSFSHSFYSQMDALWSNFSTTDNYNDTTSDSLVAEIHTTLQSKFAARVPQDWLQKIAQAATKIFDSQVSMGDQLVQCVQSVLPTWQEEDLFVLVRPVAYAMRSNNHSQDEATKALENIGDREWNNLSEIEQARLSIAIAHYALNQIQKSQTTNQ